MESNAKGAQPAARKVEVLIACSDRVPFKAGAEISATVNRITVEVGDHNTSSDFQLSIEISKR